MYEEKKSTCRICCYVQFQAPLGGLGTYPSWIRGDCKEIQPVHFKGDQPWVFFGRNDAKVETPVLWPPHAKSWLIGKDSDAGRDWGQEEKGTTEDEMMASLTQWTWVWVNSGRWWWTGRPGMLQLMGLQRVRHDWATELNWTELYNTINCLFFFSFLISNLLNYLVREAEF